MNRHNITRVVVGMVDPDCRVATKGIKSLRDNGIEVELIQGMEEKEVELINRPYIHRTLFNTTYNVAVVLSENPNRSICEAAIEEIFCEADLLDTIVFSSLNSEQSMFESPHRELLLRLVDRIPNLLLLRNSSSLLFSLEILRNLEDFLFRKISVTDLYSDRAGKSGPLTIPIVSSQNVTALSKVIQDNLQSNGILFLDYGSLIIENQDNFQVIFKQVNHTFQRIK